MQDNYENECKPFVIAPTPVKVALWVVIRLKFWDLIYSVPVPGLNFQCPYSAQ